MDEKTAVRVMRRRPEANATSLISRFALIEALQAAGYGPTDPVFEVVSRQPTIAEPDIESVRALYKEAQDALAYGEMEEARKLLMAIEQIRATLRTGRAGPSMWID